MLLLHIRLHERRPPLQSDNTHAMLGLQHRSESLLQLHHPIVSQGRSLCLCFLSEISLVVGNDGALAMAKPLRHWDPSFGSHKLTLLSLKLSYGMTQSHLIDQTERVPFATSITSGTIIDLRKCVKRTPYASSKVKGVTALARIVRKM